MDTEKNDVLKKIIDFLKVRKIWWIAPLVIFLSLLLLALLAGQSTPIANIYAPV